MWTGRQLQILEILIKNTSGIIGSNLASRLGVSDRTVRNDISRINQDLKLYNCSIQSSNQIGYYIAGPHIPVLASLLLKFQEESSLNDIGDRHKAIMGRVFFAEESEIESLAEDLYVSVQTVHKDLQKLQTMLQAKLGEPLFEIQNEKVHTIRNEELIRRAFLIFLEKENACRASAYSLEIAALMDGYYEEDQLKELRHAIHLAFKAHSIILSDDSFFMLSWALYFSWVRNQNGYFLGGKHHNRKSSKKTISILAQIVEQFDEIQETDIGFLDDFMWTLKLFDHTKEDIHAQHQAIMSDFCQDVQAKYGFDLAACEEVYQDLAVHTDFMLRRLEEGYEYENVARDIIREKYAFAYEIAMLMVPIVYRHKRKYLIDSEISYIALYIEFYFENVFKCIRTVLVSSHLPGMVNFTKQWILNNFPNQIQIVDVIPVHQLQEFLGHVEVDLIISMADLVEAKGKPVYVIDRLPKESDRIRIYEALRFTRYKGKVDRLIDRKFDSRLIQVYREPLTFEAVVQQMSEELYQKGYIDAPKGFAQDVIEREENYPTFLSNCFMVPHPLSAFAKKSVVSVAILKSPIKFKDKEVKLIFMLASQAKIDDEIQELFQLFKKIARDKNVFEKLILCEDAELFLSELSFVSI